jgi:hypothetical protein
MVKKRGKKDGTRVLMELRKIDAEVKDLKSAEKFVIHEEKKIENEQKKIESVIFKMGRLTFKRKHFLEIIRGAAGAFLGVGLGMNLLNLKNLATNLPWFNVVGILIFILTISSLLIYKTEKDFVKNEGKKIIFKRLIGLYLIALSVELIALWLFGGIPDSNQLLVKMIIIGSYSAMAGAVSFSIV